MSIFTNKKKNKGITHLYMQKIQRSQNLENILHAFEISDLYKNSKFEKKSYQYKIILLQKTKF